MRLSPAIVMVLLAALCAGCAPRISHWAEQPQPLRITASSYISADGYRHPLRHWAAESPQAVLIALHGFNDYHHFIADMAAYLRQRGISVLAYDQRGFGDTAGRGLWHGGERLAQDAAQFIRLVAERFPDLPIYLLGESMGGAVSILAHTRFGPLPLAGTVLAAPAVWGRETMPWYQRWALWLGAHTLPAMTLTGEGLDIRPSDNRDMLRALGRDPWVIKATRIDALYGVTNLMDAALAAAADYRARTLLLYGARDEIIPKPPLRRFVAELPEVGSGLQQLVLYPQGFHMLMRDLQAERVWGDIAAWIQAGHVVSGWGVSRRHMLRALAQE